MSVELAGYRSILPNSFYVKKYVKREDESVEVVLIKRYREPSEEQVARYLSAKAKRLLKDRNLKVGGKTGNIETLLQNLPEELVDSIANREENTIDKIKLFAQTYYPITPKPTVRYVNLRYGFATEDILKNIGSTNEVESYDTEIRESRHRSEHRLGWKWDLNFRLNNYGLPDKKLIDSMICERCTRSMIFYVNGIINWDEIKEIMDMVYKNFRKDAEIKQIIDYSKSYIELISIAALGSLIEDEREEREKVLEIEDKIRRAIQSRFGWDLKGSEEKRRWLFGEN